MDGRSEEGGRHWIRAAQNRDSWRAQVDAYILQWMRDLALGYIA